MTRQQQNEALLQTIRSKKLDINSSTSDILLCLAKLNKIAGRIYESLTDGIEEDDVKEHDRIFDTIYTPYNDFLESVRKLLGEKIVRNIDSKFYQ